MYAITGATGNIGSKVVEILLERGEKVRVIGRDAARLRRFVTRGAEEAVGDLKDTVFLTGAFTGIDALFAMIPPDYAAADFRAYQNDIGRSIANAITRGKVKHVVNLSSQGGELSARTGPILGLHDQEERLNRLVGVNVLHLRPTYFMENLLMNIPLIHERGIAGSAVRGDLKFAMIATKDIADRVADHLIKRDFTGKVVKDLLGQRDLSLDEAFTVIGKRIGFPDQKYVQFPYDEARKEMTAMGISPDFSKLIVEMSAALNDGLFGVNRPRTAENTTRTSIEEFAETFAEAFETAELKIAA
ncbi:MAG TPA: NmrA family NAD(P)-binding protein [Dongiaceae bacterium]|nr:NmrA family NAD(P)-binding protein [Dongiaceae bacterium]